MTHDLLIEIGCEELPTGGAKGLLPFFAEQFKDNMFQQLQQATLIHSTSIIRSFATPRRLALIISHVAEQQPEQFIERRGPAINAAFDAQGNPTPALLGFARSCGVEVSHLEKLATPQGSWFIFRNKQAGQRIEQVLPALVSRAISEIPIVKPMRWSDVAIEFIRPVQWVVMLYGDRVIPGEILGLAAGRTTYGHRFHHPDPLSIPSVDQYENLLEHAQVLADFNLRQENIRAQLQLKAKTVNGTIAGSFDTLLTEVCSLVEFPVVLLGNFDPRFLAVPEEALISSMQHHQKCFPLRGPNHKLLPYFLLVSNIKSKDEQQVITGNERVMRARLSDAEFFYRSDIKQPLGEYVPFLKTIIFQDQLGTLYDKTVRVEALARWLAEQVSADQAPAARAAFLCKADLTTKMVGEFPELQGIMGSYYAAHTQEDCAVITALREQYLSAPLINSVTGSILLIADRIDTLVGLFGINKIPTGSKDPFALRRAAADILYLLIARKYPLDLSNIIDKTCAIFQISLPNVKLKQQLLNFFSDRLPSVLTEHSGEPYDSAIFESVLAKKISAPFDFSQRINAVKKFRSLPPAAALAAANKRVSNILSKQGGDDIASTVHSSLLIEPAERELALLIESKSQHIMPLYHAGNYTEVLTELADLKNPIDQFFDTVMVMAEDEKIRANRLAILQKLRQLFLQVADISLLPC